MNNETRQQLIDGLQVMLPRLQRIAVTTKQQQIDIDACIVALRLTVGLIVNSREK